MTRRERILEEMGVTPLWRLRRVQSVDVGGAMTETLRATEEHLATAANAHSAQSPAPLQERNDSVPAAPARAEKSVPIEDDAGRRQSILGMDWNALQAAVAGCVACPLHAKRTNTVFGVGDERSRWLFVGEGPGADEDAKGEPFVGQAGRLLDNMLGAMGLKRGVDVYIANVVKCRPPNNRNPEPGEMRCCEPYLTRQIQLIQPRLIVALGKIAASHLLRTDASIASLRGRVHDYLGTPLIVTYHPAYLLRTLPDKAKSWADLCFARETMRSLTESERKPA